MKRKVASVLLCVVLFICFSAGCGDFTIPWAMSGMDLSEYDCVSLTVTEISGKSFLAVSTENPDQEYKVMGELYDSFSKGSSLTVYYVNDPEIIDSVVLIKAEYVSVGINQTLLGKPVIYLYPEKETKVSVTIKLRGTLTQTVPEYENGWTVTARSDGTLIEDDGNTYPYLFWEAESDIRFDMSSGFCIAGGDTECFLMEKLIELGLNDTEANEFLDYWVPLMKNNPYNLICFQTQAYTEHVQLSVSPEPDSILRVFMAFSPLIKPVNIPGQEFSSFARTGFTVVEWGGTEVVY